MAVAKVNVAALYAALDEQRQARNISWRQLARELDLSPSLMSRLANGLRPDVDAFATLLEWLGMPAASFLAEDKPSGATPESRPDLMAQIAPLLRARNEFKPHEIDYLEDVFRATIRKVRADQADQADQADRAAE